MESAGPIILKARNEWRSNTNATVWLIRNLNDVKGKAYDSEKKGQESFNEINEFRDRRFLIETAS